MSITPRQSMVMTRPIGGDDLVIEVDGEVLVMADMLDARAFLGDWKMAAHPVLNSDVPTFVTDDAILLEIATQERDEDGSIELLALWLKTPTAVSEPLADAQAFGVRAGRTFDLNQALEAYRLALEAQHDSSLEVVRLSVVRRATRFLGVVARRLIEKIGRLIDRTRRLILRIRRSNQS